MNIMNQLTKKHMLMNKKRTIMTILGVIVSVAMITAVSTASTSFLDLLQRVEMDDTGYWHVAYHQVKVEQLEKLAEDKNSSNVFITNEIGYAKPVNIKISNENKPYLFIKEFTKESMKELSLQLVSGRLPEKAGEILLPEHLLYNGKVSLKVGDSITVEVGNRYIGEIKEENKLMQMNPYDPENEVFQASETKTYQVVGIVKRLNMEPYSAPGYMGITYLEEEHLTPKDTVSAYVFVNKVTKDIYKDARVVAENMGGGTWNIQYHDDVLRYYGVSQYDSFNTMVYGLALILIMIIMVGSISLIYNSFAISISERSKQFGMLASVGATKRQKRNAVLFEGAVIGAVAIPLGILAGLIGMAITFAIVGGMLANSFSMDTVIRLCVSGEAIGVAILFSIATIYVSAFLPARKASRISPIEAIRQSKDIRISGKAIKTNGLIGKVLGLEGELALKNLKRNKRRYRALVFSLFISFVLFTSVGSYVYYVSNAADMALEDVNFDGYVSPYSPVEDRAQLLQAISNVEGIKESIIVRNPAQVFMLDEKQTKEIMTKPYVEAMKQMYRDWGWREEEITEQLQEYPMSVNIIGIDQESYDAYVNNVSAELHEGAGNIQGIVVNTNKKIADYTVQKVEPLDVKINDTLSVYYEYSKGNNSSTK